MFLVNLVRLPLLVGTLYESGVDAAEHRREQRSNLRETIVSRFDELVKYSRNHDTDALVNLHHPDVKLLLDGLPPVVGVNGLRLILDLVPEKASSIEFTLKEVKPMDEDANYAYAMYHYDFFNQSGDDYMRGNGLAVFKKTAGEYKFYVVMFNRHEDA